ncbi:hypothetical protein [Aeromonas dhakensis]|nr:hypothetical protein [Aeromonas dhakensis]
MVYQARLSRPSIALTVMMCRIHEVRPLICREFEMGEPDCIDERDKWFIKLD